MAENRYQNARVIGRKVGVMYGGSTPIPRNLTKEQKDQRDRETQASYEVWRRAREARKAARYLANRSRNLGL